MIPNTSTDEGVRGEQRRIAPSLKMVVSEMTSSLQVPEDMALNAILSAAATVCQGLVDVSFPDGATMPVSLCTITVADSGAGKTPCQRLAFSPISLYQSDRNARLGLERNSHDDVNRTIWEIKNKAIKTALRRRVIEGLDCSHVEEELRAHSAKMPKEKGEIIILYDDTTGAALAKGLDESWPYAVLSNTDAGNAMQQELPRQLTTFNKLLDGDEVIKSRATAHSTHLIDARLTISLAVQPKSMRAALSMNNNFFRSSGFVPRGLISIAPTNVGHRVISKITTTPGPFTQIYYERCTEILKNTETLFPSGMAERRVAILSTESSQEWNNFCQRIEIQRGPNGAYSEIQDHASKMGATVLRIAAILEFFEKDSLVIDIASLRQAIRWGEMYLENARKLYQTSLDSQELQALATQLHLWIINECLQLGAPNISRSRLTSRCPYIFRKSKLLLEEVLDLLVSGRQVQVFPVKGARFICPSFVVPNPMYVPMP